MTIKTDLKIKVQSSQTIYAIMKDILAARQPEEQHKEYFYNIGLDNKNRIKIIDLVAIGTINSCCPQVREIFRVAIYKDCASIILVHNHPSGDTKPSSEDAVFTRRVREAGKMIDIRLLDHVIVGDGYYSFADAGLIS